MDSEFSERELCELADFIYFLPFNTVESVGWQRTLICVSLPGNNSFKINLDCGGGSAGLSANAILMSNEEAEHVAEGEARLPVEAFRPPWTVNTDAPRHGENSRTIFTWAAPVSNNNHCYMKPTRLNHTVT